MGVGGVVTVSTFSLTITLYTWVGSCPSVSVSESIVLLFVSNSFVTISYPAFLSSVIFVSTSVVENVSPTLPSSVISLYPVNTSVSVSDTCFLKWTTPLPVGGVVLSSYTYVITVFFFVILPFGASDEVSNPPPTDLKT